MQNSNHHYMSLALELAQRGQWTVSPNPMAGCVIVKNGQIIGEGWHQFAGQPHAEIHALQQAGHEAKDATAYISLEPCCHTGKTPPCTNALINAGIKSVFFTCLDPNPLVSGKGMQALLDAGIQVHAGICEQQARELNKKFFHYMQNKRPYVISKWAMSLDGKTITNPQDNPAISSHDSQQHSHQIRQSVDAIIIGARTAIHDDPQLTVRHITPLKHPWRFILAGQENLPINLKIFDPALPGKTIVAVTEKTDPNWLEAAQALNIETWKCAEKDGKVDLQDFHTQLGLKGVTSVLVEGGERLHASYFKEQLVNEVQVYLAPKIISQLEKKLSLAGMNLRQLGQDIFLETTL